MGLTSGFYTLRETQEIRFGMTDEELRASAYSDVLSGELRPADFERLFGPGLTEDDVRAFERARAKGMQDAIPIMREKGMTSADFRRIFGEEPPAGVLDAATGR